MAVYAPHACWKSLRRSATGQRWREMAARGGKPRLLASPPAGKRVVQMGAPTEPAEIICPWHPHFSLDVLRAGRDNSPAMPAAGVRFPRQQLFESPYR